MQPKDNFFVGENAQRKFIDFVKRYLDESEAVS